LRSPSRKKLVVAGPGAGKTYLFKKLLEASPGVSTRRLALTFINNLKEDLEQNLAGLATVRTLHAYCQSLLRRPSLRSGLSKKFRCLPGLASIIKSDWKHIRGEEAPLFVDLMRKLANGAEIQFYLDRGTYYDAVDFDDSVFRIRKALAEDPDQIQEYDLVLIDEYQDFNAMEAALIDLLASKSPILIAGDDDQALYSRLRGSTWEFIRKKYRAEDYEVFPLPFCLRCPEVVVAATNDVIAAARKQKRLQGRIDKPFRHYEPTKGSDSRLYPKLSLVTTSVQRPNANYFGRYIEEAIGTIRDKEIQEAAEKGFPVVLVVGSDPYRRQVTAYLKERGYEIEMRQQKESRLTRDVGLQILKEDAGANLGWRVMLETDEPSFAEGCIRATTNGTAPLVTQIPEEYRAKVIVQVERYEPTEETRVAETGAAKKGVSIKSTAYEGAKGLSAQHVFVIGVHEEELPRDSGNVQDLEICKFIVGLTRTRKKCTLLCTTGRVGERWKRPSIFLSWIKPERYERTRVDATYWKKRATPARAR
jgi:superfamily I DNA/RNA helicase